MTLNIKKAGLEMVERANSSEEQVFGSFYLSRLLGLNISFKNNKCFVAFNSIPTLFNPQGTLHGGIISTLMDISMGHLFEKEQLAGTTIELKTNFLLPIRTEKIICEGSYIKKGKTISVMEAKLYRNDKKLAAYSTSTWKVFEKN